MNGYMMNGYMMNGYMMKCARQEVVRPSTADVRCLGELTGSPVVSICFAPVRDAPRASAL
ncbi:MAG: hypothetical protein H6713_17135 [Myxococcales bacterium]|nr:hypothetical protein [Myxococcales bacterium]